jgi:hypothetical protein
LVVGSQQPGNAGISQTESCGHESLTWQLTTVLKPFSKVKNQGKVPGLFMEILIMEAGVCSTCQHTLGEFNPEGMLGLFPRVRCASCGLVNVLIEGAVSATAAPAAKLSNETYALDENPIYAAPPEEPAVAAYEEASEVSGPPAFEAGEEAPAYEDNVDYDQPVPLGVIPEGEDVPELPAESTRIGMDPSEENNE